MKQPINTRRIVAWGALAWLVWMVFYAFFFRYIAVPDHGWAAALGATLGAYIPYGFISVGLWHLCRLIPLGKWPPALLLPFHFLLSMLVSALWLGISYGGWYLAAGAAIWEEGVSEYIGWQYLFGMITCLLIVGIFYTIINYETLKQKAVEEAELKVAGRDAELKALRMQINPHFLFNTLNSVNALMASDINGAREMTAGLADLFRATLEKGEVSLHLLQQELELARLYLSIEQLRFKDRLTVSEDIDTALMNVPVPVLLLQPLLENCVKHGVARHRGRSVIEMVIKQMSGRFHLRVCNTLPSESAAVPEGIGTGLENLRQRLLLIYNDDFVLETEQQEDGRFCVTIELPVENL